MALLKESFRYDELIACAKGKLAGLDFPRLPLPPMLMFDKITRISESGGEYNKGLAHAEYKITPDKWFFNCHFENDPVMVLGDQYKPDNGGNTQIENVIFTENIFKRKQ